MLLVILCNDFVEVEIFSYKFFICVGYICCIGNGIYVYFFLMLWVINKVFKIVCEEMNVIGV